MTGGSALDAWCEEHGASLSARWEFEQVMRLPRKPPAVVVEIGVHRGGSLRMWREAWDPDVLVGVDPDPRIEEARSVPRATLIQASTRNTHTFNRVCWAIRSRPIDFLYIDGDHREVELRLDLQMYAPLVRVGGGIIVLDDAVTMGVEDTEVWRVVPDLVKSGYPTALLYGGGDSGGKFVMWR